MSEPTEEEYIQQVYNFAANLHVEQKMSKDDTIRKLMEEGLDRESATIVINNIRSSCRKELGKHLFFSLLWLIGGIAVTAATYQMAEGGGSYVVAWGAILYGFVASISNFCRLTRYLD